MNNYDTYVCKRFAEERTRLKKTQGFVAEKCDVSTKTVGRWEQETAIPSDKLSLLYEDGFDVFYILTGLKHSAASDKTAAYNNAPQSNSNVAEKQGGIQENIEKYDPFKQANPALSDEAGADVFQITAAELSSLGKRWWDAVSELNETQRNAILTLVFNHAIATFIEANWNKTDSSIE